MRTGPGRIRGLPRAARPYRLLDLLLPRSFLALPRFLGTARNLNSSPVASSHPTARAPQSRTPHPLPGGRPLATSASSAGEDQPLPFHPIRRMLPQPTAGGIGGAGKHGTGFKARRQRHGRPQ
jgi:hypothetical protein